MTSAAAEEPSPPSPEESARRAGLIATASAYMLWGFLPLYLKLVSFADVREVLGQRILWCVPAALAAVFFMSGWAGGWRELRTAFKPRMLLTLTASACFIFFNWGMYVWLVLHERVIESSLAYFLTPLVSIAVGTLFFGERITLPQAAALGVATAGVVTQGLALGAPPWMALGLCATWSIYVVIRKNAQVSSATGLFVESSVLAPIAVGLVLWTAADGGLSFTDGVTHGVLLALAGPATALPLILFAFGARRVSFVTIGLLQFLAPSIQFAIGLAAGEPFTPLRAMSFGLIWVGLAIFCWDVLRRARWTAPA
ncbi:MAG: EamA family transporter RarD [Hyphomonadaceae bacterium]|nr:EamA family transporter RarD [Hyphomonadaceae bacterium]